MMYFLDTNICIYFLKGMHISIRNKIEKLQPPQIKIPSIVMAELLYGAAKSMHKKENLEIIQKFLIPFEIISFETQATEIYADIRSATEAKGISIGPNDLIIASTVMAYEGILVTNNMKEFGRIKNLKIENWL
ncbi:MAG: type II toxin-antitoxin system VapC family toxin [bacterium]